METKMRKKAHETKTMLVMYRQLQNTVCMLIHALRSSVYNPGQFEDINRGLFYDELMNMANRVFSESDIVLKKMEKAGGRHAKRNTSCQKRKTRKNRNDLRHI